MNVKQNKEELYTEMNDDYRILKTLNHLVGKTIKIKSIKQLQYKVFPERNFIVLSHAELQINKLLHSQKLKSEHSLSTNTLQSFLKRNGAQAVDPAGKPISQRPLRSDLRSDLQSEVKMVIYPWYAPKTEFVWQQNSRGFWKKMRSAELTTEELMYCSPAA
ncbi:hypothetical protein [Geobacter sp. OR-1]|uniref:hypothetical protein n=1 Tax=Geobacter sp. OR-1 TaxID=1266765 RepID=UPI00126A3398|nr:hypothetical protein [Geobacter sp. OR-1]